MGQKGKCCSRLGTVHLCGHTPLRCVSGVMITKHACARDTGRSLRDEWNSLGTSAITLCSRPCLPHSLSLCATSRLSYLQYLKPRLFLQSEIPYTYHPHRKPLLISQVPAEDPACASRPSCRYFYASVSSLLHIPLHCNFSYTPSFGHVSYVVESTWEVGRGVNAFFCSSKVLG